MRWRGTTWTGARTGQVDVEQQLAAWKCRPAGRLVAHARTHLSFATGFIFCAQAAVRPWDASVHFGLINKLSTCLKLAIICRLYSSRKSSLTSAHDDLRVRARLRLFGHVSDSSSTSRTLCSSHNAKNNVSLLQIRLQGIPGLVAKLYAEQERPSPGL